MNAALLALGLPLLAIVVLVIAGIAFFLYLLVKNTPVDRNEDRAAADRRVRDSMRGNLL